jgi:CBS domain-containing protein
MPDANAGPVLVRDLMTVGVPTCPLDTPLADLARMMVEKGWEGIVVLEPEQGHAIGAVTQDELVAVYARGEGEGLTAEDVMRPDLPTAPPDIPLTAAAQLMRDLGARVLYMTHHAGGIEYPAAWLTYTHLLRHLTGGDLSDLGARAGREAPLEAFLRRRDEARRRAGGA